LSSGVWGVDELPSAQAAAEASSVGPYLLFQLLMHQQPRLFDPVNMYADVIQRLILLLHLLLYQRIIAHTRISPALRIISIINCCIAAQRAKLLRRLLLLRTGLLWAAAATAAAAA
jgi:hypothetical protein